MKIGLVGYKGSGKSTLFEWLTGVAPDPALSHTAQSAMAVVRDPRLEELRKVYNAKKVTPAAAEIVDTPGLSRTHEGNAARLGLIREADCLVLVAAGFGRSDPLADATSFAEDLMLADMEILSGRIHRIGETLKKPIARPEREQLHHEEAVLKTVLAGVEAGKPIRELGLSDEQLKLLRAFRLFGEKPRLLIVNTADDEQHLERLTAASTPEVPILAIPIGLELELARMSPADREEFAREMGVGGADRDGLLSTLLRTSGQMLFFTAAEKEVRTWLLPQGGTALEAADSIHSDLARGFIRAEVMTCSDLIRLGSEREVKAQRLVRQEPKDYVVQDDEILFIRFSV